MEVRVLFTSNPSYYECNGGALANYNSQLAFKMLQCFANEGSKAE